MNLRASRRMEPEINLTPLIDIIFTVLMFMILTTTFQQPSEMKIVLPESRTGKPLPENTSTYVRIELDAEGRIRVRGKNVPLPELVSALKALSMTPDTDLLLSADERTAHGRVVAVMDAAREAGALKLSIETYKLEGGLRPPEAEASGRD